MSMPDKDSFLINCLPNARVYLSIVDLIQCIENHCSRCERRDSENDSTVDQ